MSPEERHDSYDEMSDDFYNDVEEVIENELTGEHYDFVTQMAKELGKTPDQVIKEAIEIYRVIVGYTAFVVYDNSSLIPKEKVDKIKEVIDYVRRSNS